MKNGMLWVLISFTGIVLLLSARGEREVCSVLTSGRKYEIPDTLFVGLWRGVDESEVGFLALEKEGYAWFVIGKDTLGGADFEQGGHRARMTYEINYMTSPKSIDFVVFSKDLNLEVGRLPGIFEFIDRHRVRLSLNFSGNKRPADFDQGDDLVTLEKVTK